MRNSDIQNYDIIIEGSSSAAGYSDESGRGGFSGRLAHHFWEYSQEGKRRNSWRTANRWVFVQNFARPGRLLPSWIDNMEEHVREVRRSHRNGQTVKVLGLVVLEAHPLYLDRTYGESARDVWRRSLEEIELVCGNNDIEPVFVQMPVPVRNVGNKGRAIHDTVARQAQRSAHSLEADIVDVASMPGVDPSKHIAEDGMHPNAAGHELIFNNLLPLIYDKLELKPLDC